MSAERSAQCGLRSPIGDVMLNLLKFISQLEFPVECGRLLLMSISASYIGVNVRRLAMKHGWDHHLLQVWEGLAQRIGRWVGRGK